MGVAQLTYEPQLQTITGLTARLEHVHLLKYDHTTLHTAKQRYTLYTTLHNATKRYTTLHSTQHYRTLLTLHNTTHSTQR